MGIYLHTDILYYLQQNQGGKNTLWCYNELCGVALKPDSDKSGWEKFCGVFELVGDWCKERWKFIVAIIKVDNCGDITILFEQNVVIDVIVNTVVDECRRLFKISSNEHLLVTGSDIEDE